MPSPAMAARWLLSLGLFIVLWAAIGGDLPLWRVILVSVIVGALCAEARESGTKP